MTDIKKYVFDFQGTRISISNLTMRRRRDATAFCSVTLPDPEPFTNLIASNPTGSLVISQIINEGSEAIVGTYILDQVLTTRSSSAFTVVLNAINTFGTDLSSSGSYVISNPLTASSDTKGFQRFSSEENALIVVDDIINLEGVNVTVEEISLFVNVVNSRMDVGVS